MNGAITVVSQPGSGSIFTVVLPVEDIELSPAGTPRTMRTTLISADPISRSEAEALPSPTLSDDPSDSKMSSLQHIFLPTPQKPAALNVNTTKGKSKDDVQHLRILVVDDSWCFLPFVLCFLNRHIQMRLAGRSWFAY